jgi:hypothetical protein
MAEAVKRPRSNAVANWWNMRTIKYATPYQREIFLNWVAAGKSRTLLRLPDCETQCAD